MLYKMKLRVKKKQTVKYGHSGNFPLIWPIFGLQRSYFKSIVTSQHLIFLSSAWSRSDFDTCQKMQKKTFESKWIWQYCDRFATKIFHPLASNHHRRLLHPVRILFQEQNQCQKQPPKWHREVRSVRHHLLSNFILCLAIEHFENQRFHFRLLLESRSLLDLHYAFHLHYLKPSNWTFYQGDHKDLPPQTHVIIILIPAKHFLFCLSKRN